MKKIFYTFLIFMSFFSINFAQTQQTNFQDILNSATMPTDEEIKEAIKQFNVDKNQEEYIFQETKRQLNEIFSNKGKLPEIENFNLNNFGQESEKQTIEGVGSSNDSKGKTKKYSKHDPIFKR